MLARFATPLDMLDFGQQDRLLDAGYPVPRPYLFEGDHEPLGRPFMIMERIKGRPLFAFDTVPKAIAVFVKGFVPFARTHAALHSLNTQIVSGDGEPEGDAAGLTNHSDPVVVEANVVAGPSLAKSKHLTCSEALRKVEAQHRSSEVVNVATWGRCLLIPSSDPSHLLL